MDNNLLNDRIGRLKEWKQTELLNEILFNALASLNEYTQERFDKLTQEIRDESLPGGEAPAIRIAVCNEENADKQVYLYPVSTRPPDNCPGYITTVFARCDYLTIQELMRNNYAAEIVCKTGTVKTQVAVRYSLKYLQKAKWLYYVFSENWLPWTTINGIYFYKFLDVYTTQDIMQDIEYISIDFAGYEEYISYDKTLLWNIQQITAPVATVEAKPAYNAILFEHTLKNIQFDRSQYLVCPNGDRFTYCRNGHEMRIRTYTKQLEHIELLRIVGGEDAESLLYLPPKSNKKKAGLIESLARRRYVPTKGEAERIVSSLREETGLLLVDIKTLPPTEENIRRYKGIAYNDFVEAGTFLSNRKLLIFTFKSDIDSIWAYETMFFMLSELQLYFYEYRCVGEMV